MKRKVRLSLYSIVKEFIVDVWESGKMRVLAPRLTLWCGILVRMVSSRMVGMAGMVYNLSHSTDGIGTSNVDLHVTVSSSDHCGCVVHGSVAMVAL